MINIKEPTEVFEREFEFECNLNNEDCFSLFEEVSYLRNCYPVRCYISASNMKKHRIKVAYISGINKSWRPVSSLFSFKKPDIKIHPEKFLVSLIIPTGIGAEFGGHAGDGSPLSILFSSIADRIITHPNVVNASDINEMPNNSLYVEGSSLTRLFMGTVGLNPVRSNRLLFCFDNHKMNEILCLSLNSMSAALSTYGVHFTEALMIEPPLEMESSYDQQGRASGQIKKLERLLELIQNRQSEFDAIALSTRIKVPYNLQLDYFSHRIKHVNPWGGIEALLTHSLSEVFQVPVAHSPMLYDEKELNIRYKLVDPRLAAECVSSSFLQCIFKGLNKSPKLIFDRNLFANSDIISSKDISALVIPQNCLGLPTLAALQNDIPVICVKDDNIQDNLDLNKLQWKHNQFHLVNNYLEAAGILCGLKVGLNIDSLTRPMKLLREYTGDTKIWKYS